MAAPCPNQTSIYSTFATQLEFGIRFYPNYVTLDRLVTPIWYILGLFGNSLSAYIWMQPRVRHSNSSAIYLAALSIWDLIFLICHCVFIEMQSAWNINANNLPIICQVHTVVSLTAQYISPLLVLAFSVERWISVCFPFHRETYCTPTRAIMMVCILSVSCFLWNSAQFYLMIYNESGCSPRGGNLWTAYTTTTEVCLTGIVPVAALIFNLLVIQELYKITLYNKRSQPQRGLSEAAIEENRRMDRKARSTTIMLLTVSFYVILTTLPAGIVYSLQGVVKIGNECMTDDQILNDPGWIKYFQLVKIKKVIDELTLSHYSLNFIIYMATGEQYRKQLKELFCSAGLLSCLVSRSAKRKHELREKEKYFMANSNTSRAQRRSHTTQTDAVDIEVTTHNGTDNHNVTPLLATYI